MAWTLTRICGNGVWRYLDKRRRSFKSTLFYCLFSTLWTIFSTVVFNNNYQKKKQ